MHKIKRLPFFLSSLRYCFDVLNDKVVTFINHLMHLCEEILLTLSNWNMQLFLVNLKEKGFFFMSLYVNELSEQYNFEG